MEVENWLKVGLKLDSHRVGSNRRTAAKGRQDKLIRVGIQLVDHNIQKNKKGKSLYLLQKFFIKSMEPKLYFVLFRPVDSLKTFDPQRYYSCDQRH